MAVLTGIPLSVSTGPDYLRVQLQVPQASGRLVIYGVLVYGKESLEAALPAVNKAIEKRTKLTFEGKCIQRTMLAKGVTIHE